MPKSTPAFIRHLARLAPQLGSSGSPSAQIADQASGGMPGFGTGGPTTTTPWGGGPSTLTPPGTPNTAPQVGVGPPTRPTPVMPIFGPESIAQSTGQPPAPAPAPSSSQEFTNLSGSGQVTVPPRGLPNNPVARALANFDPLTHWLATESDNQKLGQTAANAPRYNNLGEIYAEAPPKSNDVSVLGAFNQDRLGKIARFYGLDDSQIADRIKLAEGQVAEMMKAAGLSGKDQNSEDGRSIINQAYQAVGTDIIKSQDRNVHRTNNDPNALSGYTGSDSAHDQFGAGGGMSGSQMVSAATNSPFAQYGIWTPDQQIQMQAMIGNYVQSQDQRFAAGGGHLDPKISAAYMEQAQAMPAIKAFEGQAQLAAQNQQLQAQYDNLKLQYQFAQWQQGQANQNSAGGGAATSTDFTDMLNSLGAGGSGS